MFVIVVSGSYFGTVISLPISGALAQSSAGWPSIFYVFGKTFILVFMGSTVKVLNV